MQKRNIIFPRNNIFQWLSNSKDLSNDKITAFIIKFQNHASIMKIKSKYKFQEKICFKTFSLKYAANIIKKIANNKASGGGTPLYILKQSRCTYQMLTDCINDVLSKFYF